MKITSVWVGMCVLGIAGFACQREEQPVASQPASLEAEAPAARVAAGSPGMPVAMTPSEEAGTSGTILETMDAGQYTYVRLQTQKGEVWAAGPKTAVKIGQNVRLAGEAVMKDFKSNTLNRTFDSILFAGEIVTSSTAGGPASMPAHHPPMGGTRQQKRPVTKADIKSGAIATADGGFKVADLHDKKDELAGKRVSVRAQVVKSTPNIMGKNWLHIQDGSGDAETYDLTVTSKDTAAVGDIVLITGILGKDKDFGAGYFFPLIIEEAEVKPEGPSSPAK